MKIIYYCQHVLGVGHFFRTLEICANLPDHEIILVSGGLSVDAVLPKNVRLFSLPALVMDRDFTHLSHPGEDGLDLVKTTRKNLLLDLFKKERPGLFMVELFPFGRKAFSFELLPVLESIRKAAFGPVKTVCSLRDILVEKNDRDAYEKRVLSILDAYFDALLVHSDPDILPLSETFGRVRDISIPVVHTGFVSPVPKKDARQTMRKKLGLANETALVVASAGSGSVGFPLLKAAMEGFGILSEKREAYLHLFTGPYLAESQFDHLKDRAGKCAAVERFTPDFLSYLSAADQSVSMAGYNTLINVLATGVPALVLPFDQNREQGMRAQRFSVKAPIRILEKEDLEPEIMAQIMEETLSQKPKKTSGIHLDGAQNTALWLLQRMKGENPWPGR